MSYCTRCALHRTLLALFLRDPTGHRHVDQRIAFSDDEDTLVYQLHPWMRTGEHRGERGAWSERGSQEKEVIAMASAEALLSGEGGTGLQHTTACRDIVIPAVAEL